MDISVFITSDLTSSERRISPQWNLDYLKSRMEQITGVEPRFQTIRYYPISNSSEYSLVTVGGDDYSRETDKLTLVSTFSLAPLSRLHVEDLNPELDLRDLADGSDATPEFQLSEEAYAARTDSVLEYKRQNKLGRFDKNFQSAQEAAKTLDQKRAAELTVGGRCRVVYISSERRGVVRFIGPIPELDNDGSLWVGIEFDEPLGKHDGCIDGRRIFECRPKHGSFLRPSNVEPGEFPELDPFSSDEDDAEI